MSNDNSKKISCNYLGLYFFILGPRKPSFKRKLKFKEDNYVSQTFPEDTSSSSDDQGESTRSYVAKVTTKKFKLAKKTQVKVCTCPPPRPISPIVISLDEELERSMVELEMAISLEMSDTD